MSILGNPSTSIFMLSGTKINIDFKSAHPKWCCIFPRNDITKSYVSSKHIHELTLCYVTQCNLTPFCKHILNLREMSVISTSISFWTYSADDIFPLPLRGHMAFIFTRILEIICTMNCINSEWIGSNLSLGERAGTRWVCDGWSVYGIFVQGKQFLCFVTYKGV